MLAVEGSLSPQLPAAPLGTETGAGPTRPQLADHPKAGPANPFVCVRTPRLREIRGLAGGQRESAELEDARPGRGTAPPPSLLPSPLRTPGVCTEGLGIEEHLREGPAGGKQGTQGSGGRDRVAAWRQRVKMLHARGGLGLSRRAELGAAHRGWTPGCGSRPRGQPGLETPRSAQGGELCAGPLGCGENLPSPHLWAGREGRWMAEAAAGASRQSPVACHGMCRSPAP